jgi:hypothetical protein
MVVYHITFNFVIHDKACAVIGMCHETGGLKVGVKCLFFCMELEVIRLKLVMNLTILYLWTRTCAAHISGSREAVSGCYIIQTVNILKHDSAVTGSLLRGTIAWPIQSSFQIT